MSAVPAPAYLHAATPPRPQPPMSTIHRDAVRALTDEQAQTIWDALKSRRRKLRLPSEDEVRANGWSAAHKLLILALDNNLIQPDLVLSIARDASPCAVAALETLIGKPITRPIPKVKSVPVLKPKTKSPGRSSTRPVPFDLNSVVRLLVSHNPKRAGCDPAARFALYRDGMPVSEALQLGVWVADVIWDVDHGYIKLEPAP